MILHLAGDKLCCTKLSLTLFLQTVIARCTFFPVDLGKLTEAKERGEGFRQLHEQKGTLQVEELLEPMSQCSAVYGPVRTVQWEGRGRKPSLYPIVCAAT